MEGSGRHYDEVAIGESFRRSLTVTDTHIVIGAGLIGDFNPHHVDDAYASGSRFGTRILHGMLTSAMMGGALGMIFHGTAVALLEHGERTSLRGGGGQLAGIDVAIDRLSLFPRAAVVIDAEIPADADEPRLEVRAPVEGRERLEDLQEDVLREIFRLVVPPDELVGDVEHLPPVPADDDLPGEIVAVQAPLDERFGLVW